MQLAVLGGISSLAPSHQRQTLESLGASGRGVPVSLEDGTEDLRDDGSTFPSLGVLRADAASTWASERLRCLLCLPLGIVKIGKANNQPRMSREI